MRRYSPQGYSPPPRRDYGGRGRSPPRRGYGGGGDGGGGGGGGYGRRREQDGGSLLVRNIPLDCRPEELRVPFERFGIVRDVYIPKDYYTGDPRGFAFVQFIDSQEALDAQHHLNGKTFAGREIAVVVASEARKRPEEMRHRTGRGSGPRYGERHSSHYGRSRQRSISRSRSRSPRYPSGSRNRNRSRSLSPAPKRRDDYSASPGERHRDYPRERNGRSNSPPYDNAAELNPDGDRKTPHEAEDRQHNWRSPARMSRSPSQSRLHR